MYNLIIMRHYLTLFLLLVSLTTKAQWLPDSLLAHYSYHTVKQPDDYQGSVISTIIKHDSIVPGRRGAIYIHGFNDYFFQGALGDSMVAHGWNFRAVDLRRYGRSLKPGMKRYQVRNLNEYFPDIDSAVVELSRAGIDTILMIGHSTGGLIASLYMNGDPSSNIKGLILNSPFLSWNMGSFTRNFLIPAVSCLGSRFPNIKISQGNDPSYGQSLYKEYNGEWEFDTTKKLLISPPVTSGWIHAIEEAQNFLHKHSNITVPILLMHSDRSVGSKNVSSGDAVLNVNDISKWGRKLGPNVTEVTVPGGLHDLILSSPAIRKAVYNSIFKWLHNQGWEPL